MKKSLDSGFVKNHAMNSLLDSYEDMAARLKLHNFDISFIGMWCHLCLFQNGPEFASMALRDSDRIKVYCVDMLALWSYSANGYQSPGNPEGTDLADETVVETMLFLCEQMARFFAQVSTSCPAIQNLLQIPIFLFF